MVTDDRRAQIEEELMARYYADGAAVTWRKAFDRIRALEAERGVALAVAEDSARVCEILRNHRGRLENALAEILEHPDASQGIQSIARAALAQEEPPE